MNIKYRRNTENDAAAIRALIDECFGYTKKTCPRIPVDAYLLAFDGEELVAITGILTDNNTDYIGGEIGWTCCKKSHRGHGIITYMINLELNRVGPEMTVYCECWATGKVAHVKSAMAANGFRIDMETRRRRSDLYKSCETCVYKSEGGLCSCSVLLYRRMGKQV